MKKILGVIQIVWDDITNGRNLDAYIAILAGISLSILDIFGIISVDVIGSSILLVLTLLVFGSLANRISMRRVEDSISRIAPQNSLLSSLAFSGENLRQIFRESESIDISGISLYRLIPFYHDDILYALKKGCRLRVLLVNPESTAMQMSSFRGIYQNSIDTEKQQVQSTREFLENLERNTTNINIELRAIDLLPSYGLTIVHPRNKSQKAHCLARIFPFRASSEKTPAIKPDPVNDKFWFDFFVEQFEKMWAVSQPL